MSGQDFTVFMYSSPGQIDAEVVFVGYGLVVPPFDSNVYPGCPVDPAGFDEYAGVDLAGKIALIVLGAPTDAFANCPFEYAGDRLQSAHARGAGGVITVGGDGYPQQVIRGYLTPDGSEGMPLIAIDRQRLESALPAFASWLSDINTTLTPQSRALGIDGSIAIDAHVVDTVSHNVLGMIPGSDPVIGDEIVIVSGHIDALGVDEQTGAVYAGANDNASGTVAAYRLAEQILAEYGQPKRTLLVAAWNGEETGLRGSCYYAANPVHPLSDTVAVVNIEMLSSGDGSSVLVYGEDDATTGVLFDLLEAGNERLGVPVQAVGLPMYSDSDHWCFYERGIAATSIRGGPYAMAPGYHTPQDNMNNFVMADMHQGMNAVWGLLAPLALGLEVELLTNSTRRLERGFGPPFTSPPLLYSPLGVPPLTSPTITSTPFQ